MPPHRRSRKSPGAKPLTSQREQYLGLMRQGTSNAAACRLVGVNRKTGHRWRYGRSVTTRTGAVLTYPAITGPADPVSARCLVEAERIAIADGLSHGLSLRMIAAGLGRAPSTISREVRRNRDPVFGAYHPFRAGRQAAGRRVRPRRRKLGHHAELRTLVADHLERTSGANVKSVIVNLPQESSAVERGGARPRWNGLGGHPWNGLGGHPSRCSGR